MMPKRERLSTADEVTTEKEMQASIVKAAKECGWLVYYDTVPFRSVPGWPDLVLLHREKKRILIWELKTAHGILSAAQAEWLDAWKEILGAIVSPAPGDHVSVGVITPANLEEAYRLLA